MKYQNILEGLPYEIIKLIADLAGFYKFNHLNKNLREKYNKLFYENHIVNIKKINSKDKSIEKNTIHLGKIQFVYPLLYFDTTSLTHLTFDDEFDQPLNNSLPKSLTHLIFGKYFNQPLGDSLKYLIHLTHLDFSHSMFNQPIDDSLKYLKNLTHLTSSYYFNQSINNLPNSLTHLTFGDGFNQSLSKAKALLSIDNILPPNLTHLVFGFNFNQPLSYTKRSNTGVLLSIDNILPQSLTHLTFGDEFNQPITDKLPPLLQFIEISDRYNNNKNIIEHPNKPIIKFFVRIDDIFD